VALGRGIREPERSRIVAACLAANSDGAVVEGRAPITPLLVAQVEEALDRRPAGERAVAGLEVSRALVAVGLRREAPVRVVAPRLDRLHRPREAFAVCAQARSASPQRSRASTAARSSASAAGLSSRWRSTRAKRSATPPG
jgi:hypothetical protein